MKCDVKLWIHRLTMELEFRNLVLDRVLELGMVGEDLQVAIALPRGASDGQPGGGRPDHQHAHCRP
jgi:hypothetical protein